MDIDKIIEQARQDLQDIPSPTVTRSRNGPKISVTYHFGFYGEIENVKLIASYRWWIELDADKLSYNDIESVLSKRTAKKVREALERYANEHPDDFRSDMTHCRDIANSVNPLHAPSRKARGGSPYGLTWEEIEEIRATARHFYTCLKHNKKNPESEWPETLRKIFDRYKLELGGSPAQITYRLIQKAFSFKVAYEEQDFEINPYDVFYQKHILSQSLANLDKSSRIFRCDSPFLKALLK